MAYVEMQPAAALRPWIECFWSVRSDEPSAAQRILPDGCADLVFDLTSGENMVVGTMTAPVVLPPGGRADFVGVRFRPGCAAAFLRMPLAEVTDDRVPLADVWRGWDGRTDLQSLQAELLRRLDDRRDRRLDTAVSRVVATGGALRIDDLARDIGISRQHLARLFLHHVGVPPKAFARIIRFRGVVSELATAGGQRDWADIAAHHGYYDQAHLTAEFRQLAGTTPGTFHFSNR